MKINDENMIEITEELSSEYEVSRVLRDYPKDTVIIKNVKGFDMPVISVKIAVQPVCGRHNHKGYVPFVHLKHKGVCSDNRKLADFRGSFAVRV
jgi:UbiD family decarboxylase